MLTPLGKMGASLKAALILKHLGTIYGHDIQWVPGGSSLNGPLYRKADVSHIKEIHVAGKSRLKLHLKPLKMTGIIVIIERVDTIGRESSRKVTVNGGPT